MEEIKPIATIPHDLLPEAQNWRIGKVYRVKLVLRQVGSTETSADFEIVDASSLEAPDKAARAFMSDSGVVKG